MVSISGIVMMILGRYPVFGYFDPLGSMQVQLM